MLILDFYEEYGYNEKIGLLKKFRKNNKKRLNRYSIDVNGKNITVLELNKRDLLCEDVQMLLKVYKGRVLVSEKYMAEDMLQEYLYNPKQYFQRAILSSLYNQVRAVNKEWNDICIKTEVFSPFKELFEIVRISKKVTIVTGNNAYTDKFLKDCYYRYGAIVFVKNEIPKREINVYLDLDEIEGVGKLMIKVKDKDFILYADTRYFENKPEYHRLLPYKLEHNIICSLFSDK